VAEEVLGRVPLGELRQHRHSDSKIADCSALKMPGWM
jgi:hypothetical protein